MRLPIDVAKLEARLSDGRVIHDGQKPSRIRHDGAIKQRFVVVEKIDQVDIPFKISWFLRQLQHHPLQLQIFSFCDVGNEADESERLLFGLCEAG